MELHHLHLTNPWAILVSALIQWFLGALWYSPALFARPWMAMLGITPGPQQAQEHGLRHDLVLCGQPDPVLCSLAHDHVVRRDKLCLRSLYRLYQLAGIHRRAKLCTGNLRGPAGQALRHQRRLLARRLAHYRRTPGCVEIACLIKPINPLLLLTVQCRSFFPFGRGFRGTPLPGVSHGQLRMRLGIA